MPRQFDIVENLNPGGRSLYPFLIVLQHDHLDSLRTIIVAPLVERGGGLADMALHPVLDVDGRAYNVLVDELAAVPRRILGRTRRSAEADRYQIVRALDLLFTGY